MNRHAIDLRNEWQAFWLAVGFLSRVPMLVRIDYSQRLMNQCSTYFPLVGLLLGVVYAAGYSLLIPFFSSLTAVLLVLILHLWITGAFHEDGLADSVDALGGGCSVERRLEIMKDSRIGTYGTVALILALALKTSLVLESQPVWLLLLVTPAIARFTPLLLMSFMPYVTDRDKSRTRPVAEGFSRPRLLAAAAFTVLVALVFSLWHVNLLLAGVLACSGTALVWGWYLKSRLGGYTGDTLGASVILSELALLMMLAL